jgi:hypothetical protein
MANMTAKIEKGFLIVSVPVAEVPGPSASGKTLVVASTHGNAPTTIQVNGKTLIVGLNAYIRA